MSRPSSYGSTPPTGRVDHTGTSASSPPHVVASRPPGSVTPSRTSARARPSFLPPERGQQNRTDLVPPGHGDRSARDHDHDGLAGSPARPGAPARPGVRPATSSYDPGLRSPSPRWCRRRQPPRQRPWPARPPWPAPRQAQPRGGRNPSTALTKSIVMLRSVEKNHVELLALGRALGSTLRCGGSRKLLAKLGRSGRTISASTTCPSSSSRQSPTPATPNRQVPAASVRIRVVISTVACAGSWSPNQTSRPSGRCSLRISRPARSR